jgi:hypothetical protein
LRVLCDIVRKEFQSDESREGDVFCFIDNSHPATAQLFDDAVVRDGLVDHGERKTQGAMLGMSGSRVNEGGTLRDAGNGKSRDFRLSQALANPVV